MQILLTQQVKDEVFRSREAKMKEGLEGFQMKLPSFPNLVKSFDEYHEVSAQMKALKQSHKELNKKVKDAIANKNLDSDKAITHIFSLCNSLPVDKDIVEAAILRYHTGNPPGKDRRYGDAINWISLLESVPDGEDLYFVGADKDYESKFVAGEFNTFLADEWNIKKGSNVYYFTSLTEFFNKHLTEIQLANELTAEFERKENLVKDFENSYRFAETHSVIRKLMNYDTWSEDHKQRIAQAAIDNFQISWINTDPDVVKFLNDVAKYTDSD